MSLNSSTIDEARKHDYYYITVSIPVLVKAQRVLVRGRVQHCL